MFAILRIAVGICSVLFLLVGLFLRRGRRRADRERPVAPHPRRRWARRGRVRDASLRIGGDRAAARAGRGRRRGDGRARATLPADRGTLHRSHDAQAGAGVDGPRHRGATLPAGRRGEALTR